MIFHRYFRGKINDFAVEMEKEAVKLLEIVNVPSAPAKRRPEAAAVNQQAQRPVQQAKTAAGGLA